MRSFFVLSLGVLASVSAQSSTPSYSNYESKFTSLTNSRGVVTGQPTPVLSQPSVITSMPSVVTSNPPYAGGNSTVYVPSGSGTMTRPHSSASGSSSAGMSSVPAGSKSAGASGTPSQTPNAAPVFGAAAGGSVLGLGALVAALL